MKLMNYTEARNGLADAMRHTIEDKAPVMISEEWSRCSGDDLGGRIPVYRGNLASTFNTSKCRVHPEGIS
ncbi:MAG: hypothetical protein ACI9E1_001061 [Cryomorphaceae bacterium]|jgi:hypothetical protein